MTIPVDHQVGKMTSLPEERMPRLEETEMTTMKMRERKRRSSKFTDQMVRFILKSYYLQVRTCSINQLSGQEIQIIVEIVTPCCDVFFFPKIIVFFEQVT